MERLNRPPVIRFGISAKLGATLAILALIVLASASLIARRYDQLSAIVSEITTSIIPSLSRIERIGRAAELYSHSSWQVWIGDHSPEKHRTENFRAKRERGLSRVELSESISRYSSLSASAGGDQSLAQTLEKLAQDLVQLGTKLEASSTDSSPESVEPIPLGVREQMDRLVERIRGTTGAARQRESQRLRTAEDRLRRVIGQSLYTSTWEVIALLTVGGLLMFLFANRVARTVQQIRDAALAIGRGNFDTNLPPLGTDELGELATTLTLVGKSLKETTFSKQLLTNMLASLPHGVLVTDIADRIILANTQAKSLLGFDPRNAMPAKLADLAPALRKAAADVSPSFPRLHAQLSLPLLDGRKIDLELSAAALMDSDGLRQGTVIILQDIGARLETEASLRRYREELAHSEQLASLGAVSAQLAHKFNQPLTVITLLLQQAIRAEGRPEVVTAKMRECLEEVRSVSSTIKEVLRYTRPATLEVPQLIAIAPLVERVLEAFRARGNEVGMELRAEGLLQIPTVSLPRSELEEIICTLVQNAIEAAPNGRPSSLTISGSVDGGEVELVFSDTGVGIAEEHVGKIFDLFFSTKPRHVGTGLGLGIVKQLVEGRGGGISVISQVGVGSTFTIRLPIHSSEHGSSELGSSEHGQTEGGVSRHERIRSARR